MSDKLHKLLLDHGAEVHPEWEKLTTNYRHGDDQILSGKTYLLDGVVFFAGVLQPITQAPVPMPPSAASKQRLVVRRLKRAGEGE